MFLNNLSDLIAINKAKTVGFIEDIMKIKRIVVILLIAVLASLVFACDVRSEVKGEEQFSCTIFVEKDEVIALNCVILVGEESESDFNTETALKPSITVKSILDKLKDETDFSYSLLETEVGTFINGICDVEADSLKHFFACYINEEFVTGDVLSIKIEDDYAKIEFVLSNHL